MNKRDILHNLTILNCDIKYASKIQYPNLCWCDYDKMFLQKINSTKIFDCFFICPQNNPPEPVAQQAHHHIQS